MSRQLCGACANCRHFTPAKGQAYKPNTGICTRDNIESVTFDSARPSCFSARENGALSAPRGAENRESASVITLGGSR